MMPLTIHQNVTMPTSNADSIVAYIRKCSFEHKCYLFLDKGQVAENLKQSGKELLCIFFYFHGYAGSTFSSVSVSISLN